MPETHDVSPHERPIAHEKLGGKTEEAGENKDPEVTFSPEQQRRKRAGRTVLTVLVLLVLVTGGGLWYLHSRTYEETDDAQVDGHIDPISARIAGTVTAVYVQDDDYVQAGKPLVDLDTRTQMADIKQRQAQFQQAVAQLQAQQPNLPIARTNSRADLSSDNAQLAQALAAVAGAESDRDQAKAKIAEAEAQDARDQAQAQRYKALYEKKEAAREQSEKYASAAASSDANVLATQAAFLSASKLVEQRKAQADAQQTKRDQDKQNAPQQLAIRTADIATQRANEQSARAALEKAELDLTFTKVTAPVSGIVTLRSAEIGSQVAEGAQLMMLVQSGDLWINANFKETQLRRMHPKQSVRIHVDTLDRDFDGYVESMPAITGARSSVLPPENATGNYVKVVQRLTVRIRFKPRQDELDKLRPGMSCEPHVYLR